MPPSASLSPAAIIAEYSTLTNLNYCGIAGFVLILHDYLVTFRQEVNMFWTRKLNGAAILFYLNRYSFITVYAIYQLSTYAPISEQSCPSESRLAFGIRAVAYAVWAVFAGLRAYALSWNWPLGLFVLLLQSVPIGINLSLFHFGVTGIPLPRIGCELSDFVTKTLSRRYAIASRSCVITADFILICITWFTLPRRRGIDTGGPKMTFSSVLLRDGTIYFVVLLVLNCLHLTLTLLAYNPAFQDASYLPSFTEPITAILVSRFLLDLQYANHKSVGMNSSGTSTRPDGGDEGSGSVSLTFERFVGSIGTSIVPGDRDEDDIEDEI